jgi:hypothetical protein
MECHEMANLFDGLSETARWRLLVDAAKKALIAQGYALSRVPGRGLSNIWNVSKDGKTRKVAIRTTRDRWIAFQPLHGGTKWKTLDDVETVVVAAVDSKDDPENVEIYIFPADEVRYRFNAADTARANDRQASQDGYGMWVGLDRDDRGLAASVGSGIVEDYNRSAIYSITDLLDDHADDEVGGKEAEDEIVEAGLSTIGEVMAWTRDRIAQLSGVQVEAVKLDLKIEY